MSNTCLICNKKIGILTGKVKLKTGENVCKPCLVKCGYNKIGMSELAEIETLSKQDLTDKANGKYISSKKIEFTPNFKAGGSIMFDDTNRLIKAYFKPSSLAPAEYVSYDDILDMNVVEDNNVIKKTGAGGAIGGALLFGPAGAIIGGLNSRGKKKKEFAEKLHINLILKDGTTKTLHILDSKTKIDSLTYRTSHQTFLSTGSKIESILNEEISLISQPQKSIKDELLEFKELLDLGIITQQEFDAKKLEILKK